jgi:UDP-N-acetylglucosamine 2-epimerase (non-hydrolysing)
MPFVLITGHRRENFGLGFKNICKAIKTLSHKFPDHLFVYPVHLNPNVRKHVMKMLKGERNIILSDPVDYVTFVRLMANCTLILTDSGGIQEESPAFGKPVLVMRDTTERPEAIWAGTAKLVGTDPKAIINSVTKLLNNYSLSKPDRPKYPFGNGNAAKKVVSKLK